MNRSKHPERAPYKRKATATDRTRNYRQWRVEGSWNHRPNSPSAFVTQDEPQAHRVAREWADRGAYVILEQHRGDLKWRTVREIDGPALAAERRQAATSDARHAAQERADARRAADEAAATTRRAERREQALDRLARVMVMPPVPREAPRARHTTGGTR